MIQKEKITVCNDDNLTLPLHEHFYSCVEWSAQFNLFLRAARRSPGTRREYRRILLGFGAVVTDLRRPEREHVHAWIKQRQRALSRRTLNNEISAIRCFYDWMARMAYTSSDLRDTLPKMRRAPPRLTRTLSEGQVGKLLAAPELNEWGGFRDHVVLRVLYETGITAAECAALTLGSVRADGIVVMGQRLRDQRLQPISSALLQLLDDWQNRRREARPGKSAALFITRTGAPFVSGRAVWDVVNRYARAVLGVGRGYEILSRTTTRRPWGEHYPHLLRASFAAHLLQRGVNLRAVQQLMGHADPRSTETYKNADVTELRREVAKLRKSGR